MHLSRRLAVDSGCDLNQSRWEKREGGRMKRNDGESREGAKAIPATAKAWRRWVVQVYTSSTIDKLQILLVLGSCIDTRIRIKE
jgi:hypothetical protein